MWTLWSLVCGEILHDEIGRVSADVAAIVCARTQPFHAKSRPSLVSACSGPWGERRLLSQEFGSWSSPIFAKACLS